ncbi:MAG TPA: cation diffusion facilitator family transporter [Dehalococcoidales bacterium]|jgi:cation diffusion facilitator family transporter|nr:cation diffusion facilitator family transporter [Dehalococcoidales bacterium]
MIKKALAIISTRSGSAKLALGVVTSLIILKVIVAFISHSISITAQATDSFLDLFSIGITVIAVHMSVQPADEKHPFGHGKMEGISALIQAFLVLGAGGFIIYSAIQRIIHGTVIKPDAGIAVMVISIIASYFLSRHLRRVAKATESTAIDASAQNISADVYSAAGVLLGLLAVLITGWEILDPIVALVMVGFVLKAGYETAIRAFRELTDYSLPKEDMAILNGCIREHFTELVSYHAVRSRRAGSERFVELHLVMPRDVSVEKAHQMCDLLENDIREKLPNSSVTIHVEPCDENDCARCEISVCDLRKTEDGEFTD